MGNSPGFSFLLSETPPAVQAEPVRPVPAEAPSPSGDLAPLVRKVQFPTRLAQSVSDRPPGARLRELDDDLDDAPPAHASLGPASPSASRFSASEVPPEDLPILRRPEPEPTERATLGNLSAALLSRLRRTKEDADHVDDEDSGASAVAPSGDNSRLGAARAKQARNLPTSFDDLPLGNVGNARVARTGGTFARALWGHARSPLAALLVAGVFYVGGTELIGRTQIALSKPAVPAVPELGTLDTAKGATSSRSKSKEGATPTAEGASATIEPASRERAPLTTEVVDLPAGLSWPGKGLVEVVTPEDELIYVDGVFIGRGPLRRIPLTPGEHEVWIQKDAMRQSGKVQVVLDRSVRAVFAFR